MCYFIIYAVDLLFVVSTIVCLDCVLGPCSSFLFGLLKPSFRCHVAVGLLSLFLA